jgi:fluoroquinolone transport system ATP-binding protein
MISVENLSYTYTGAAAPAVRNLSFRIRPGEVFGFLGPSGAGKSTTQKILIRLLRGYQGSVTVMDRDLETWQSDYYERIGVSFEVPNLYQKLTGLENLAYYGSLYSGKLRDPRELLAWVALEDDGDMPVSQYSKGMKNRLNVARALLHDPELLFMDEPTTGLDPVNARRIKDLIRAQREAGKTIFLTTHNMSVADELCDRVAFIVDGKIALIGAPRQLKLDHGEPVVRVETQTNGALAFHDFPLSGLGDNVAFFNLLRRDGVQTIHTQEATLETVFIRVTGRSLT